MPLGDSITRGWWGSQTNNGYRGPLYSNLSGQNFDFVGSQLDGDFPDTEHEGYDAKTASWLNAAMLSRLVEHQPDIILYHIGTNNLGGSNINAYAQAVDDTLEIIFNFDPDTCVILAKIILTRDDPARNIRTHNYNILLEGVAQSWADAGYTVITVDMENALNYIDDMDDNLHPNDLGYAKMADVWADPLLDYLTVPAVNANPALVYNGGFDTVSQGWNATGEGAWASSYASTGGNPGGYISLQGADDTWSIWYEVGLESLAAWGIPAETTVTCSADIIDLGTGGNDDQGGLKAESWDSATLTNLGDSGEQIFTTTGSWASYSFDYTISPGADAFKLVVLNVNNDGSGVTAKYGFDNVRVTIPGGTPALKPVPNVGLNYDPLATSIRWQNPDPKNPADTVTAVAYLLESDVAMTEDPNLGPAVFDPGVVALTVDSGQESATVALSAYKHYYWAVHVTDPNSGSPVTVPGYVWNFQTNNTPPTANAGADQYLVSTGSGMVLNLDATVTDDGTPTITWTDITVATDKDPNTTVTINSTGTEDTTVTLTGDVAVTGYYQFEIFVDDGVNPVVTSQVIAGVYPTCADAAAGDPDDTWDSTGDLDGSCTVDLADWALFAATWLDCNSLRRTCP